jgi:hypothetical protein
VSDFTLQHPDVVMNFVAGHYMHNQVESLLILPDSPWFSYAFNSKAFSRGISQFDKVWEDCCSVKSYISSLPYWRAQEDALSSISVFPMLVNLALVALGIGASWKRRGWVALLPLWLEVCYILSVALGRQSGWRFTLPVDWVVILYYAAGIAECTFWVGKVYVRKMDFSKDVSVISMQSPEPAGWFNKWAMAADCSPDRLDATNDDMVYTSAFPSSTTRNIFRII